VKLSNSPPPLRAVSQVRRKSKIAAATNLLNDSGNGLTSLNRRSEDVRIFSIIIAELEFRDVQRYVFGAHLVERAHHAGLEDRPEAFNRLGVNRADDVLPLGVVDDGVRIFLVELIIAHPLVGTEQADFVRDGFADEFTKRIGANILDNAGDHIALALDRTDAGTSPKLGQNARN
jgi:hypothetical protein